MLILEVIAALVLPSVLIIGLLWVFPPAKDDRPAAKLKISTSTTRHLVRPANKGKAVEFKDVPVAVSELGCFDGGGRVSQGLLNTSMDCGGTSIWAATTRRDTGVPR